MDVLHAVYFQVRGIHKVCGIYTTSSWEWKNTECAVCIRCTLLMGKYGTSSDHYLSTYLSISSVNVQNHLISENSLLEGRKFLNRPEFSKDWKKSMQCLSDMLTMKVISTVTLQHIQICKCTKLGLIKSQILKEIQPKSFRRTVC
jgi:hypothetical protein